MMDCIAADALVYAAIADHPLGQKVAALLASGECGGSVLLLAEVLGNPLRDGTAAEVRVLAALLARLDLHPIDRAVADLATAVSAKYGLHTADAVHLATAIGLGAQRFITNNRRDFAATITEVDIVYLSELN